MTHLPAPIMNDVELGREVVARVEQGVDYLKSAADLLRERKERDPATFKAFLKSLPIWPRPMNSLRS
jgi:hypothetical protein